MADAPLRWVVVNFRTLILSFGLALVVWVSAVLAADPNETRVFTGIPLEVVGKAPDMLVMNSVPQSVSVTLYAPRTILQRYATQSGLIRSTLDLSGLEAGTHRLPVMVYPGLDSTRQEQVTPASLEVILDRLVSVEKPIRLEITGRLARGYQAETPTLDVEFVTVTGAESLVSQVVEARATLDITGLDEDLNLVLPLEALDENGDVVQNIQISPESVDVFQPITLLGGYRNVVVKVITEGQIANGYRLTNISVSPPSITVFSANPQLVSDLPGFVETEPLDLDGLTDDLDARLALNLPSGITVVGEQSVLVQVNIAAIESSVSISLPVEVIGLGSGLSVQVAPDTVNVILSGPVLVLDILRPEDVRVYLDASDLLPGTYQLRPTVDVLLERLFVETLLPETLEVIVAIGSTPTPIIRTTPIISPTMTIEP